MDFLDSRKSGSDVFREDRTKLYAETLKAQMFCMSGPSPIAFTNWIRDFAESRFDNLECGHILLVPSENKIVEVDRQHLIDLALLWRIPAAAAYHLTSEESFGHYEQTVGGLLHRWYGIPVPISDELSVSMRVLSSVEKIGDYDVVNTVMFCPSILIPKIRHLINDYKETMDSNLSHNLKSLQFQALLVGLAISSWKDHHTKISFLMTYYVKELTLTEDKALSGQKLAESDQHMIILRADLDFQIVIQSILKCLDRTVLNYRDTPNGGNDSVTKILEASCNLHQVSKLLHDKYKFIMECLDIKRNTYSSLIQSNNAQYLRTNTIALRRMAELNGKEAAQVKALAQASQRDAHDMKRVAYLTMVYLPPTFAATFFSMPFMSLSDNLVFTAWPKIWIYFVVCAILTVITFSVSIYWETRSKLLYNRKEIRASEASETASNVGNKDHELLEPPASTELASEDIAREILKGFLAPEGLDTNAEEIGTDEEDG